MDDFTKKFLKGMGKEDVLKVDAANPLNQKQAKLPVAPIEVDPSLDAEYQFLDDQAFLESNHGANTDHKRMPAGIHKGDAAIGKYGLMPNTIVDVIGKVNNPEATLYKHKPATIDSEKYSRLSSLPKEELAEMVRQDPELEQEIARMLAREVLVKTGGDPEKASYAWQYGHNLTGDKIKPETLNKTERIKRLRDYKRRAILKLRD